MDTEITVSHARSVLVKCFKRWQSFFLKTLE